MIAAAGAPLTSKQSNAKKKHLSQDAFFYVFSGSIQIQFNTAGLVRVKNVILGCKIQYRIHASLRRFKSNFINIQTTISKMAHGVLN
jgi:hypothetical protein